MTTGTKVNIQGIVHRTVVKPPVLNDEGFAINQDLEIVLHVPLNADVRAKLIDIVKLQDGQITHITLENAQQKFDTTGIRPDKKTPKKQLKEKKKPK